MSESILRRVIRRLLRRRCGCAPAAEFDLADDACVLCHGDYPPEELVRHDCDACPDVGPVCLYCLDVLNAQRHRQHERSAVAS